MTPMLVSTIIPVFNRPQMLREAVQSVLDQTYRPIEILIADDGSTDTTPDAARELEREHSGVIRYLASPFEMGAGPGPMRELGRQHASGEFIQYLDSDDRLTPNKFADQVRTFHEHPECDIAYGITRLVDELGRHLQEPFKWTGRGISQLYPGLLVDRWWCTHTPLYRRNLCDRIGPWSSLRWSQDWEYDARAGKLGAKLVSCQTLVSEHRHHDGVRQTSHADWSRDPERLTNRRDLLTALWHNVPDELKLTQFPERRHFARWCFSVARMCAASGLTSEMKQLLILAETAAGSQHQALKGIRSFRMLSRVAGVRLAGQSMGWLERFRRGPGSETLPQSFMEPRSS